MPSPHNNSDKSFSLWITLGLWLLTAGGVLLHIPDTVLTPLLVAAVASSLLGQISCARQIRQLQRRLTLYRALQRERTRDWGNRYAPDQMVLDINSLSAAEFDAALEETWSGR